jgi:hypothetical protein
MGVELPRMAVEKLSLRRGEVLVLLSDGVDGEEISHVADINVDGPPGELAEKLLKTGMGDPEDDATAAILRLRPAGLPTS